MLRFVNLTELERSTLYYICGYICFKEDLEGIHVVATHSSESEFTELVSRGLLKHPPSELYDLSLYLYTFFKNRQTKCCSRVFLQGITYIYESTGCQFQTIDSILKRFINSFCKGYCKDMTDQIKADKRNNDRKKRKLDST